MRFLADQLVVVQLREENWVVFMLVDSIPHVPWEYHRGTTRIVLFDIANSMAHRVLIIKMVLMDSDLCPYLIVLLI